MKTKRFLYWVAACVIGSLLIIQTGCKKDETSEDPGAVLAENTKVISKTTYQNSIVSVDTSNYTFVFNKNISEANLKTGDIMVSGDGDGFLRKVKSISAEEEMVMVTTEEADMEDAIANGDIEVDGPLNISDIKSIEYHCDGISLNTNSWKQTDNTNFTWDINAVIYENTNGDQIKLVGEFSCSWGLKMSISYKMVGGLKKVKFGFESSENLDLSLIADFQYNDTKKKDLMTIKFKNITVTVAGCPVVFKPVLKIKAEVSGYANAYLTTSFSQSLSFDAGIQYIKGDGWSTYKTFDKSLDFTPPQITMNAGAQASIIPELSIMVYGVAGPSVDLKLYSKLDADIAKTPWWELHGGLELSAGVKAKIFGKNLFDKKYSLITYDVLIAQASTPPPQTPVVTTAAVTNVSEYSATCGGNVTSEGNTSVTVRGVCFGTSPNPTTSDMHTSDGAGPGSFTSFLYDLAPNTPYYVRAYATNNNGTGYGSSVSFTTQGGGSSTVTDIDGNVYQTVTIGSQTWMAENLKVTRYRNGDIIPNVIGQGTYGAWRTTETGAYCFYGNDINNKSLYGAMYNWYAVNDNRKIAPEGWHVPTDEEWCILENFVDQGTVSCTSTGYRGIDCGKKLKTQSGWNSGGNGTNAFGFSALPGGNCDCDQNFSAIGAYVSFWSSTEKLYASPTSAWCRAADSRDGMSRSAAWVEDGRYIRCVKDN